MHATSCDLVSGIAAVKAQLESLDTEIRGCQVTNVSYEVALQLLTIYAPA